MARLTERTVQTAKTGRHSDGDGLQLVVGENGRKKWVLRYQVRGVRRDKGLGSYPEVGLKEARSRAGADRGLIAKGVDPIEERRAARKTSKPVPTFGDIAQLVIADAQGKSTNAKVRYQWERHLGPAIPGPCWLGQSTRLPPWTSPPCCGPSGARSPRSPASSTRRSGASSSAPASCSVTSTASAWPTIPRGGRTSRRWGLRRRLQLSKGRHPSLPYPLMPEFMADLRARDAIAARALEFLILTNVRTDAVLKATWDQFDLDQAVWTVPLVNLKDRKHRAEGFRVPLTARAVEIVRQMRHGQVSRYVFPGQASGKPLSNMALLTLLKRMNSGEKKWLDPASGRPITAHGFRATFRTWAEEVATVPHAVIEQAMGHQVGTQVERAYRRTDVLDKRRALMETWAQWCEPNAARRDYVEPFGNRTAAAS